MDLEALAKLIEDQSDSLQVEMRENAARIERAVKRHSRFIVSGTEAIAGLEKSVQAHDELIAALQARVRELEKRVQ
jgi:hypothetical protein